MYVVIHLSDTFTPGLQKGILNSYKCSRVDFDTVFNALIFIRIVFLHE